MRTRLNGFAGLLLTAYFAAMGGFHHHDLPRPNHDHAGFCSQASVSVSIESCAICQASHSTARLAALPVTPDALGRTAQRVVTSAPAVRSVVASLLSDPRAPPAV